MALFREHISVGALAGVVGVVLLYFYALVTDPLLLALLFIVTTISSFLPDLDSDSGIPFYTVFGLFTLACTGAALFWALTHYPTPWYYLVGIPAGALVLVWFVLGGIFKRFTHHRGIMHSVPAMAIVGLCAFLAARHLEQGENVSLWFAAFAALGFLTHLVLDEVHSEVNFDGIPFVPKKSLGTALKLFSGSFAVNMFTYLLLALLAYTAYMQ